MQTVRCISGKVSGLLEISVPQFGFVCADGDEIVVADDVAHKLLDNPNFEAVNTSGASPAPTTTPDRDTITVFHNPDEEDD